MKSKPIVGVMPLWDEERESLWMLPGYLDGIMEAGAVPFIFPFIKDEEAVLLLTDRCDGILFTGGQDVSPAVYREEQLENLVFPCEKRDEMEMMVLKTALTADKPVLGICRGMQFINAALGGTLYQDIPLLHPSEISHRQQAPYDIPSHEVKLLADTPLAVCCGMEVLPVNSCHHQGIKSLADSLEAMAVSPDGIIEAVYKPDQKFLWAVQWHPEFSYKTNTYSKKIFKAFVDAMKKNP